MSLNDDYQQHAAEMRAKGIVEDCNAALVRLAGEQTRLEQALPGLRSHEIAVRSTLNKVSRQIKAYEERLKQIEVEKSSWNDRRKRAGLGGVT